MNLLKKTTALLAALTLTAGIAVLPIQNLDVVAAGVSVDGVFRYADSLDAERYDIFVQLGEAWTSPAAEEVVITLAEPIEIKVPDEEALDAALEDVMGYYNELALCFQFDRPDLFWIDGINVEFEMWMLGDTVTIPDLIFTPTLCFDSAETAELYVDRFQEEVDRIVSLGGDDRSEILRNVHDAIIENTYYDFDMTGPYIHSAVSALVEPGSVCQGYAEAFKVVCDALNIPCALIGGGNHMWNYVLMEDGYWYGVDCTWDDSESGDIYYDFFLKGADVFFKEHTEDTELFSSFGFPVLSEIGYEPGREPAAEETTEADTDPTEPEETEIAAETTVAETDPVEETTTATSVPAEETEETTVVTSVPVETTEETNTIATSAPAETTEETTTTAASAPAETTEETTTTATSAPAETTEETTTTATSAPAETTEETTAAATSAPVQTTEETTAAVTSAPAETTEETTTVVTSAPAETTEETTVAASTDAAETTEETVAETTEAPTESTEAVIETTEAVTEATENAPDEELPQTGRNSMNGLFVVGGAVSLMTIGTWAVTSSGVLRKKKEQ